jgi:HEAT repeat protein
MYNFSQRFTALLLLFSITLQSCYTPLKISHKKSDSTPKVLFKPDKDSYPNDSASLKIVQSDIDWLEDEEDGDSRDNRDKEKQVIKYEKTEFQESPVSSQIISEGPQSQEEIPEHIPTVSFYKKDGVWKAKLEETSGSLERSENLDVVCSPGMDLEVLNHMPKSQSKQLIHRVKHPKKDFIYLGKMGLQGGMFGNVSDRTSMIEEKKDIPSSPLRVLGNVIDRTVEEKTVEEKEDKARELSISPHRRPSKETVQVLIEQRDDLQDTESLVRAFNNSSGLEMVTLQRWLEGYIDWFTAQPIENLRKTDLEEYSSLADIQPNTQEHKSLIQRYLFSLSNKIESNTHGLTPVVQTVCYSLMSVDKAVFEGDTTLLIQLGNDLLNKLNSEKTVFSQATYSNYLHLLYALHQTFVLIQLIDPIQWSTSKESDEDKRVALYYHFKEKLEAIKDNEEIYYPFVYHSMLLLQSLSRLEIRKEPHQKENINQLYKGDQGKSYIADLLLQSLIGLQIRKEPHQKENINRLYKGVQGRCYIDKVIGSLLTLDLDTYSLQTSYESLKASLENKVAEAKDWYDLLQAINQAAFLSLAAENETNAENFYCVFKNAIKKLLTSTKNDGIQAYFPFNVNEIVLNNEEAERALNYGIIGQLMEIALESTLVIARLECIAQLESLTETENCAEDADVMEELLNSLAAVAKQRPKERQLEARKAKYILENLKNSIPKEANKRGRRNKISLTSSQQNIKDWLGKSTLEEKLEEKEEPKTAQYLGCVYSKVSESLGLAMPMPQAEARQMLQSYYQDKFAYIDKLCEEEELEPVDSAQYQLMMLEQKPVKEEKEVTQGKANRESIIEQKNRPEYEDKEQKDQIAMHQERMQLVKTPIKLEDLFKARSKQEGGGPLQEVRKVLLVGNPGTGKTTVSRQLAYLWSKRQGDQSFQNVYVLPVRDLQQTEYDGRSLRRASNLATAIANLCFGNIVNDEEYNRLLLRINVTLKSPNTLVVLDGLDERLGATKTLIKEAQEGNHKLLMLSRHCDLERLEDLRKGIDLEVEHAGFSQAQVENYVQKYFAANKSNKDSKAKDLLKFLKQYPSLSNIAHVPVNLCILCSLWNQNSSELEKVKGSLTKLYEGLAEHLWKRYAQKYNEQRTLENKLQNDYKDDLFDTLGEIALLSLEKGEVLISYKTVDKILESVEDNELMLNMLKGSGFLEKVGVEYQFPHLTFQEYFAGKELARQLFSKDIQEQNLGKAFLSSHKYQSQYQVMLSFMAAEVSKKQGDEGIVQLLRMINEGPKDVVGLHQLFLELRCLNEYLLLYPRLPEAIEKEFGCMARINKWIQRGLEDVRGRYYSKLLNLLTGVIQSLPAVAKGVIENLVSAAGDKDPWLRYAASSALGDLAKVAPIRHAEILPTLLRAAGDKDAGVSSAAIRALGELVKASPEHAPEILPTLLSAAGDKEPGVRLAAIRALGELVKASPEHASAILPTLLSAAGDEDSGVRYDASSALVELVKVAPGHAEILPMLVSAAGDKDRYVRSAAISALGGLVKVAPGHVPEILPMLVSAAGDKEWSVRLAVIRALGELVKASPEHASEILPTLVSAAGDMFDSVRSAAISALGELVKASPEHAPEIIPTLLSAAGYIYTMFGFGIYIDSAHSNAISVIGELVKASPEHASEILPTLLIAAGNKDYKVSCAAISALGELVKAFPGHAPAILPTLVSAAGNKDYRVREAGIRSLGDLVKVAPGHVPEILPMLVSAAGDRCDMLGSNVCYAAIDALGELVKASPEHASEILPTLLSAAGDRLFGSVRSAAISALGELVKASPNQAPEVIPTLVSAAGDMFDSVRSAAIRALVELVKASPNQAPEVIPTLVSAAGDKEYNAYLSSFSSTAISAIGELVKASPEHASAILPTLLSYAGHKYWQVCSDAICALGELVKVSPGHAPAILPTLLSAAGYRDGMFCSVSSAAISALVELVKVSPGHAPAILPTLLILIADKDKIFQADIRRALEELVKASQEHTSELLPMLLIAAGHKEKDVNEEAISALKEIPLVHFIHSYLSIKSPALIPYLVYQAYQVPFVFQDSKKGYQQLITYPTVGAPEVLGEYPISEVENFMQQIFKYVYALP